MHLYLDIETAGQGEPDFSEVKPARILELSDVPIPGNVKKAETIERRQREGLPALQEQENLRPARERAEIRKAITDKALSALFGQIVCIGVARNEEPARVLVGDEKTILEQLGGGLAKYSAHLIVTFNGSMRRGFDIKYLAQRAAIQGVRSVCAPLSRGMRAKPWERPFIDVREAWTFGETFDEGKQGEILQALGIECLPDTITGADVPGLFLDGKLDLIVEHCRTDVEDLRKLHHRLMDLGMCE